MSNWQGCLSPSSWQKGTFTISDKSTKNMNLKVTFVLLPGYPPIWIKTCRNMSYSLWFNFLSLGHVFAKLLSIRSQVNVWHQTVRTTMHATLHCSCSNRAPSLSWASLYFSGHHPNTLKKLEIMLNACDKPRRDGISSRRQCLLPVGWAGTFVCF